MFSFGGREDRYFAEVRGRWTAIGRSRESGLVKLPGERAVVLWGEGLVPAGSRYAVLGYGEKTARPLPGGCVPFVSPVGQRIDCLRVAAGAASRPVALELDTYDVSLRRLASHRLDASAVESGCSFSGMQLAAYDGAGTAYFPVQCPSDGNRSYRRMIGVGPSGLVVLTAPEGLSFHDAGDTRFWSRLSRRELREPVRFARLD